MLPPNHLAVVGAGRMPELIEMTPFPLSMLRKRTKLKPDPFSRLRSWTSLALYLAIAVSLTTLAADQPDDAKALQGTWLPVKAEFAGQPVSDAVLKVISLKLDGGKYEVFVGEEPDRGTYTIDSTIRPKGMTISGTEGPNKGKTIPAIYELTGATLRICYELAGTKRPTEFETRAGTKLYLVTYNRKKQ